ncbi:PHP domain-containing protein [Acinetobacter brisouii]|uniref:PHP domain-containing protein n=1 Tax=Acinetobacter brisouii TaxID=396323 RepID=UPI00124D5784|nr:PHP domain-containing protein [Acinetobacter brisouii]
MSVYNTALSVQSDFSVGRSMMQVGQLVEKAKELGYERLALVDDMSVHALVEFNEKCKKNGIQPILGCRLRVYDDATYRKPSKTSGEKVIANHMFQPKVYAKSEKGFRSILRLLTQANTKENFYYHSRTDLASLLALEDVVVTTGDMYGLFSHPKHVDIASQLLAKFGDDFYVELNPINTPLFDRMNTLAILFLDAYKSKSLVTYPFCYLNADDADTLDVLSAITSNTKFTARYRPVQAVKEFAFFNPKDILQYIKDASARQGKFNGISGDAKYWIEGVKSTNEIASKALYQFEKMDVCLPKFGSNEFKLLCDKCGQGWIQRFASPVLGHLPTAAELRSLYIPRLNYELDVLRKMGFESYFLLVEDLVTWSKNNNVIVGPGRGSCFLAGHQVATDTNGTMKAIEDFNIGDKVIAHDGSIQEVIDVLSFDRDEEIIRLEFDNGVKISCTKDHKFYSKTRGWIRADEINDEDEFDDVVELAKEIESKANAL